MARQRSPGDDSRRRSVIQREALPFALGSRTRDHRQSVVRATVLWTEGASDGEQQWNYVSHRFAAARSTPANRPRKDWSRTSTRCMRSARLAKRSSRVRPVKDGVWLRQLTTMVACRVGRWNAQPYSIYWKISGGDSSTWWSFTRSIA